MKILHRLKITTIERRETKGLCRCHKTNARSLPIINNTLAALPHIHIYDHRRKVGNQSQSVEENLETITASAISTPHRHFSHTIWPHVVAHPAPITLRFSSGLPLGLPAELRIGVRADSDFVREAEDEDGDDDGVGLGKDSFELLLDVGGNGAANKGLTTGASRLPRSFSPIFGKSRM